VRRAPDLLEPDAHSHLNGLLDQPRWHVAADLGEHVHNSIAALPDTLLKLFNGENFGKPVLKVGEA
jgi:NADPH-dependent curcumin reductase CurA